MSESIVPAEDLLPHHIPLLYRTGRPIFPGIFTPLLIEDRDEIELVNQAIERNSVLGIVLAKDPEIEGDISQDDLFSVGTVAKIIKKIQLPDGGMNIFISTLRRFTLEKLISKDPLFGLVSYPVIDTTESREIKALTRSLLTSIKKLTKSNPLFTEEMRISMVNIDDPGKMSDLITSILDLDRLDQQDILETFDVQKRMEKIFIFIKKEEELLRVQKKIQNQLNKKIEKNQREYFLREELKVIQQELGIGNDPKNEEFLRFKNLADTLPLNEETREKIQQELDKFSFMEPNSSEFNVTRTYLETILSLPWEESHQKDFTLRQAERVLQKGHYGLNDVKDRIIEYLAVRKKKEDNKGSIICLIGPPGVGKTSIGKSIAESLHKEFFRFSVGGMRDEAEIKGHRRTYVGAMPGKIIQGLKITKTKDPVFMIDEIDKMGVSMQGDPSAALLEVLDPEQNSTFRDHYLDIPFDLSQILFVVTANTLDTIPRPLLDRMEIIRLSGYITEDKIQIAKRYLIPKSFETNGIQKGEILYPVKTLRIIADQYARDAGMRSYEKFLNRIHRKIAREILDEKIKTPFTMTPELLKNYLGKPYFEEDDKKKAVIPGTCIGLAWTSMGGDTLLIEAVDIPGKGGLKLTGQMGDVMKESASIAYTYVHHIAEEYGLNLKSFEERTIHLHIPEGATPKDGPSAGAAMATTIFGLLARKVIKKNLAMTGELSLGGRVMAIGGLKEKTIAAKRHGIKHIIIPKQNERDLDDIPDRIKKGLSFYPVETLEEVLEISFGIEKNSTQRKRNSWNY